MDQSNPYSPPSLDSAESDGDDIAPFDVTVDGGHTFVAEVLQQLLENAAAASVAARASEQREIRCRIAAVNSGSTLVRWIMFNVFGRPEVQVDVEFYEAEKLIATSRVSATTFFLERKDLHHAGFLGAGTNRMFLATTCRRAARSIVERACDHFGLSLADKRSMMRHLHDEPMLPYMLGGIVAVTMLGIVGFWGRQRPLEVIGVSLTIGVLFGTLLGYAVGRLCNWLFRLFRWSQS